MTIPFIDIFKNVKARLFPAAGQAKPGPMQLVRAEKSMSDRLSKTVLPTKARERMPVPIEAALGGTPAPRAMSLDPSRRNPGQRLVKASVAMDAQAERAISIQISDFLDQLPPGTAKSKESFDSGRAIVLKATEVEKGMASGKPSVSLASIFQQAPEIFVHDVSPDNATPVLLPFTKVLDQFANLRVRQDQVSEQAVPQLDTPFLAVTIEDTQRFGTTMKPLEASSLPPVKVQTATAQNLAAAEPEPAIREVTRTTPTPSRPVISLRDLEAFGSTSVAAGSSAATKEEQPSAPPSISPHKIPFHLPPNGTGESASERVPASSGPPVPIVPVDPKSTTSEKSEQPKIPDKLTIKMPVENVTPESTSPPSPAPESTAPPKSAPPARIPFKFKSPSDDIRPKFTLVPGVEPKEKADPTIKLGPKSDDIKIALPLQPLLQELPAFQLNGSPMSVGEDVRIQLPFSMIEPQLASGRVMIAAKLFQRAIPELHRGLFVIDQNETPVTLPLPEVLRHLPSNALQTRADQEEAIRLKEEFTTPFSIQADEDAKRFDAMTAATQKTDAAPGLTSSKTKEAEGKETVQLNPVPDDPASGAQSLAEPKTEVADVKKIVARASTLPGVGACAITFADGLSLAGNIPPELGADGICAMTPSLWQRIHIHVGDTKLGALKAMTLHCAKSSLTFFMEGDLCLTAVHAGGTDLSDKTQSELEMLVQKLSQTYAPPALTDRGHQGKD